MKFSCLQENLSNGLQIVTRAVAVKTPLPILSNVLITTEEGRIKLAATNLETTIVTYIGGSINKEGSITVPAKLFKDFVTNLSPSTVKVEVKDDVMYVESEKTKSKFNGMSSEDFPELPEFPKKIKHLDLDPKTFSVFVSSVAFASGSDDSRSVVFTGVFLDYRDGKMIVACTDGFRLSEKTLSIGGKAEPFSIIIPAKTLLEVSKIFVNSEEPVKFAIDQDQNKAMFTAGDTFVSTTLLDGEYPDYKRIIPSDSILSANFFAEEFLEAVKLTNVFAKEASNIIKMRFDPEGFIKIASMAEETGEHESNVKAEIEGDLLEVAISSKYLLDYLGNIKTEKILFSTNGNVSPCLLKSDEHENFIHIIMPMQL